MESDEEGGKRTKTVGAAEVLPEIAVNLSAAVLVWLFGVLVFLPMAIKIDPKGLSLICSLVILLAFSFFLIRGIRGLGKVLDAASYVLTHEFLRWRRMEEGLTERMERMNTRFRVTLHVATIIIVYLFYLPLLLTIHPAINGIALILTILGILWTLLKKKT